MRGAVLDRDDHLVPVLRSIFRQVLIGTGQWIVAALQLWLADEDTAVGVRSGSEFQLECEVLGELARGPHLLDAASFRRCRHDDASMLGDVATIAAGLLAIEVL